MEVYEQLQENKKNKLKKLRELAKHDNKKVGDFSGMKSSAKDESHTKEINSYMEMR